jgi:hypothetical protein
MAHKGHKGPIQQFTECCLHCGENTWSSPHCFYLRDKRKREEEAEEKRIADGGWYPNKWPDM